MNRDLTKGPVIKSMLMFAIPAVGVVGIWWSVPIGWFLADLTGLVYYKFKKTNTLDIRQKVSQNDTKR